MFILWSWKYTLVACQGFSSFHENLAWRWHGCVSTAEGKPCQPRWTCWLPYQLTVQKVKGQWPSLMSVGRRWNKWHCALLNLSWLQPIFTNVLIRAGNWELDGNDIQRFRRLTLSVSSHSNGLGMIGPVGTHSVCAPELHELTGRKPLLWVRNK